MQINIEAVCGRIFDVGEFHGSYVRCMREIAVRAYAEEIRHNAVANKAEIDAGGQGPFASGGSVNESDVMHGYFRALLSRARHVEHRHDEAAVLYITRTGSEEAVLLSVGNANVIDLHSEMKIEAVACHAVREVNGGVVGSGVGIGGIHTVISGGGNVFGAQSRAVCRLVACVCRFADIASAIDVDIHAFGLLFVADVAEVIVVFIRAKLPVNRANVAVVIAVFIRMRGKNRTADVALMRSVRGSAGVLWDRLLAEIAIAVRVRIDTP